LAAPTKPFSVPHENKLKQTSGQNVAIRTMGIGHVGIHFQPGLPAVLQEIFGRHAKASVEHRNGRLIRADRD